MTAFQTRKEMMALPYIDKETALERHQAFWGQFVNDATISHVVRSIGADRLASSSYAQDPVTGDVHLNDINDRGPRGSLPNWDRAGMNVPKACKAADLGMSGYSYSDLTCITKEAARQHIDRTATDHRPDYDDGFTRHE